MPPPPASPSSALAAGHAVWIATAIAVASLTACAGSVRDTPGAAPAVFVASGRQGTVHRLDPVTGQERGTPLPVPGRPLQLAPAPGGGVLVLSVTAGTGEQACRLSHLAAPGVAGRLWVTHPLPLPPAPCTQLLLAGDGQRYAIVATQAGRDPSDASGAETAPLPSPCRVLVFDLLVPAPGGPSAVRDVSPCPRGAAVAALAAGGGSDGAVVYVGLWWTGIPVGRGAVLAVDPATGAVLSRAELAGAPERLLPAPAPGGAGSRLYVVEGTPGPDGRHQGILGNSPPRWRLLTLEPNALTVTGVTPLDGANDDAAPPVAAAPDGARLFLLFRGGGRRTVLQPFDATTGVALPATALPAEALGGLLATDERVYVPDALGHRVWIVDHRRGQRVEAVAVGRGPVAITSSPRP